MSYEILMLICWCFHYVFNTINTSSHNLHWVHLGIKGKSSCLEILRGQIIAVESNKKARRVLQFQTQKNVIEMLQYHNIHTDGKIINYGSKLSYAMQTVPFNVRCTLQYNAICQEGGGGGLLHQWVVFGTFLFPRWALQNIYLLECLTSFTVYTGGGALTMCVIQYAPPSMGGFWHFSFSLWVGTFVINCSAFLIICFSFIFH